MSKKLLYTGLKADLLTVTAQRAAPLSGSTELKFKTVRMYRNELLRESEENNFPPLPACMIELLPSNYMELSNGVQCYELTVRLHILFESYKDEDTDIFALVDQTYAKIQGKSYGNSVCAFGKMKRRNEEQNFDHDNVQDYIQDYDCGTVMDYTAQNITKVQLNAVDVIPVVIQRPVLTGFIETENGFILTTEDGQYLEIE